jgi:hypothetical protein
VTILRVGAYLCAAAAALAVLARSGVVHRFDPTAPAATRYATPTARDAGPPARAAG